MRFMKATTLTSEVSKTQHEDGSFCTIKLSVTPFRGLKSAKQVYDALLFYFFNMEISISEFKGATTVNENHENNNERTEGVLCHRLVSDMGDDTLVEKNSIQFIALQESVSKTTSSELSGREYAFITFDFVNEDDLYPYCPTSWLRKDVNTVLRIASHLDEKRELVVVLTNWICVTTRPSQLAHKTISSTDLERIHDQLVHSMDALPISIRQTLHVS